MAVLVLGSANMDLVVQTPHIPIPGETVLGDRFQTHPGGKGANQAVAASRVGASVAFVGCVGDDAFGAQLREGLESAQVDLRYLETVSGVSSGIAVIEVDRAGQNSIVVAPGANHEIQEATLAKAIKEFQPRVVLAQLEVPIPLISALAKLMPPESLFVLNPAPAAQLPADVLARVDVITPNESETEALTGIYPGDEATCIAAAESLMGMGAKAVVITLGSRGCFIAHRNSRHLLPAHEVAAIDATGAGDAFNGALACQLDQGVPLGAACEFANRVAALSTQKAGAQDSMPTLDEVRVFGARN